MSVKGKYRMVVKVLESRGKCEAHREGDIYEWDSQTLSREKPTMAPICPVAHNALFPKIYGMEWDCTFPFHEDTFIACCPDLINLVVFEITRVLIDENMQQLNQSKSL